MKRNDDPSTKEKLLESAIKLFLKKGFRGTTIEDITLASNISKGAFYWHFSSKNEILASIMDQFDQFLDTLIASVQGTKASFLTKFQYYHKLATEFALHNRDLCVGFMTLSAELAGSGVEIEQQVNAIYGKYRTFLKGLIETGKKENVVRPDLDSAVAAHVVIAINNGMLLEWYMNQKVIDGREFAKTYRDVTLTGILKKGVTA
jgi:AcrR family transcriptional regulator